MKDIHDVLNPFLAPDYSFLFNTFYILLIISFLLFLFFIIKKFFNKKKNLLIIKKSFFDDLEILKQKWENNFDTKLWKELSFIFKNYISEKKHSKIFFLSFLEIKNIENLSEMNHIFENFEKEFYSYEKKWKEDFLSMIEIILKKLW